MKITWEKYEIEIKKVREIISTNMFNTCEILPVEYGVKRDGIEWYNNWYIIEKATNKKISLEQAKELGINTKAINLIEKSNNLIAKWKLNSEDDIRRGFYKMNY